MSSLCFMCLDDGEVDDYFIVLYCIVLYCIVLYCIVLLMSVYSYLFVYSFICFSLL